MADAAQYAGKQLLSFPFLFTQPREPRHMESCSPDGFQSKMERFIFIWASRGSQRVVLSAVGQ